VPARHDGMDMVSESQRRAADKYQKSYIQQHVLKLNVRTDMDIIRFLWGVDNKNALFKRLLREEIKRNGTGKDGTG